MRFPAIALIIVIALIGCSRAPERAQPVGRTGFTFSDAERPSWSGAGNRPLLTTVWYPAVDTAKEVAWRISVFHAGWTAPDADIVAEQGPFPLVVLSHGTGSAAAQLSWLAEALASNGYIVAAVNHHGNTAAEPDYLPQGFVLWWERARDVSVVIDALINEPGIGEHIDRERIGVGGFSLGGYTALAVVGARLDRDAWGRYCEDNAAAPSCTLPPEAPFTAEDLVALEASDADLQASLRSAGASFHDDRVDAAFVMAPVLGPALDRSSLAWISAPVRIVVGELDDQALPDVTARRVAADIPGAELELIPEVGHYAFLAPCGLRGRLFLRSLCVDAGGVNRRQLHDQVASDAVAFFDRTLKAEPLSR